jgi:hypothetical protein
MNSTLRKIIVWLSIFLAVISFHASIAILFNIDIEILFSYSGRIALLCIIAVALFSAVYVIDMVLED